MSINPPPCRLSPFMTRDPRARLQPVRGSRRRDGRPSMRGSGRPAALRKTSAAGRTYPSTRPERERRAGGWNGPVTITAQIRHLPRRSVTIRVDLGVSGVDRRARTASMNRMRNVSTGGPVNAPKGTSTRRPKGASRTTTATQGDGSTDSPLPAASEDAPAGTSAEQATAPTEASRSGAAGSDESTVAERPSVPERPTVAERPAVVGAALAAGWVAASGAIVCAAVAVIGWFGADGGTAGHAVSVGFDIWLLAHGAAIAFSDGSFSLVPLGLTGIVALVLARA